MKPTDISTKAIELPDSQFSILFSPNINSMVNNNPATGVVDKLKVLHHRFPDFLELEFRNLLGHINLSVEMIKSIRKDDELDIYLDIILRNSLRIKNLVHEHFSYQVPGNNPNEKLLR